METKTFRRTRAGSVIPWRAFTLTTVCLALSCRLGAQPLTTRPAPAGDLDAHTREQIRLLTEEKLGRTPAQKKVDSQLLYATRQKRQGVAVSGVSAFRPSLELEADGRVLVDVRALVSPGLINAIRANGGVVLNSFPRYATLRALVPVEAAEALAQRPEVRFIRPAARAMVNAQIFPEGGDIAHRAAEARSAFFSDGSNVKIGVLSDSIDGLTNAQATGDLPFVTVLPGQAGTGNGEGTAMLEIAHALAPGSALYFATALNSEAGFAQNIRDLYAAGCRIIVDDVTYFDESPFQDGIIAQAVNDVSAGGALYFSSAGNSGGVDRGTSGTWEGDFKDAGPATLSATSKGPVGHLHDFGGGITYNTMLAGVGFERLDLTWSDPLGQSTNDYDVYVLDSSGNVVRSSTNIQDGNSDPYESLQQMNIGDRIVIVKFSGEARFLHLATGRGHLTISTAGATTGHNASGATNAFCIGATRVATTPVPFVGGADNPVENFSSDGPRHIFYNPDGSPITPGDVSSTGGRILQKPDLTAADGVYTSLPGFSPFGGTSAAAPHAAAIAALLWSYNPFLSPAMMRTLLTTNALPIAGPGFDRNSGAGIVMAYPALAAAPPALLQSVQLQDANQNGKLDPSECANLVVTLQNSGSQTISGVSAVLSSSTHQVYVDPLPRAFADLQPGQSVTSSVPFKVSTGPGFVCGSNAVFLLEVTTTNLGNFPQPFILNTLLAGVGSTNTFVSTNVPAPIPDAGETNSTVLVSGIALPLSKVQVGVYITHPYDQDLRISLISPDGTEVVLSANNGQGAANYGLGCGNMTFFSDDASNSIDAGAAPFLGAFAPDQPLSAFQGKSGDAVNGLWTLHVMDQAAQDAGTLQCWSLQLTPIGCFDGGGQCLSPPDLTQDLSDKLATNGATVDFTVAATGTGPLAYQWYFNRTTPLNQQTNATLELTNIGPAQVGAYEVVVTNLYGSLTSAPANLSLVLPASIPASPADQFVTNGDAVTWSVQAQGTPPVSYQWYFNVTNILVNATNSTLVLTNVDPAQAGTYEVFVTNAYGGAVSAPARLVVYVPPTIVCNPDTNVVLGSAWAFNPPAFSDSNLVLTLVGTTTNILCGESFSATRQWLVSDTNNYKVPCTQTINVLATNPPLMTCHPDKSVVLGEQWSFDVPLSRDAAASEALVYDNWTNDLHLSLDPGLAEVGNQITLGGSERYPGSLAIEYWGTNASQGSFVGAVQARVRFYLNDGPALSTGEATPGTLFYDSGPIGVSATNRGELFIQEFALSAAVPLTGTLPTNFTWTVAFSGLGSNDAAGLSLFGPPVAGQAADGYWMLGTNGWALSGQPGQSFGGQLSARSGGVSLTLVGTVTNALCAQSFSATRTWQAVDACGNSNSCSQTVTVEDHSVPLIVNQPQDLSALVGQDIKLSVDISSCPPVSYQWYFNETNALNQATNAQLLLPAVVTAQAGLYQVVITNAYGSVTSAPANLTVTPPPTLVSSPGDQVATNGDTVQMSVAAQGDGPLFYQWYFEATNALPDATNTTLTLSNVTPAEAGSYTVSVSDAFGSITSAPAQLQVLVLPVMVSIQSTFAIPDPGTVQSKLTVSGLHLPLGRVVVGVHITHPYDNDLTLTLIGPDGTRVVLSANNGQGGQDYGASCDNMTIFSDTATNSIVLSSAPFVGVYRPQQPLSAFAGKSGSQVNGVWTLRIQDQAPPDAGQLLCWSLELDPVGCLAGGGPCLTPPQVIQDLSDQVVTNGATAELAVGVQGADPLLYQWYLNGTNALPQATNSSLLIAKVTSANNGIYQVAISNQFGSTASSPARLTVISPALILANPTNQVVTNGSTVTWTVAAQGDSPLSFQWFFEATNALPFATNSSLVLAKVTSANAGAYQVIVSNVYASVTSAPATLTVIPRILCNPDLTVPLGAPWAFMPPVFDDTNLVLTPLTTVTNPLCGLSFSATRDWLVSDTNGYQQSCSQTFNVLATNGPTMTCPPDKAVLLGNNWSFDVPLARDPTATRALVYDNWTNNLDQSLDPGGLELGNQITLGGPQRYPDFFALEYWGTNSNRAAFDGAVAARIRFYLNDGPTVSGQAAPGTVFYDSGPLGIAATNRGALVIREFDLSAAVPLVGALPSNFTWTVSFTGLGSNDAAGLNLYGPPVAGQAAAGYWILQTNGWQLAGQAGQAFGGQLSALSAGVSVSVLGTVTNNPCDETLAVTRTWQALDSCNNPSTCSQTVTLEDPVAPVVLTPPQSQAALAGQTVTLTVGLSSCPPLTYQWYFNQTNAVAGGTNSQLVLSNIGSGQDGTYFVAVINAFGSVTSATATVTVHVPAVVVQSPADQVATNGDNVHWRVLSKGTPVISYQWYFNATNLLSQQTNATLDLTNVTPAQAGTFEVVLTNLYGSATSVPANLTIVSPPSITTNLSDQIANNGNTVSWIIGAQGTPPLTYQWYFNSTIMGLETNASLVLSNIVPTQAGTYQVVVANLYGSVTSAPANLKIVVVPIVTCSPGTTVAFGTPWDFSPPVFTDTNLILQVLSTTTNLICGNSFAATRQWVVSDTNGVQVSCSQTVQVTDTIPPVITCPSDRTVSFGSAWAFGTPQARDIGAVEALVYDNWTNNLHQILDPGQVEVGNQIALDGTERFASRLAIEYWGTNATQSTFAGNVTAEVRFYLNNGPAVSGQAAPGTVIYDSGPISVSATAKGALVLQDFNLGAVVPLQGALPSTFTWTVLFSGLSGQDAAGLSWYGPPVTGQAASGYWALGQSGWSLQGQAGQSFGGQLSALSAAANLSVVSTVTNATCGRGFSAVRTWQALDACSNAAVCSQTVTVVDQSPPIIASQSQDQAVLIGQSVNLTVSILSCPPLAYQWYFNLTNALAQQTNATLALTNLTIAQAGAYTVAITNTYGSTTSAPINLTISGAPTILLQPQDVSVATSSNAVFLVSATGAPAPSYQWFFNLTNLLTGDTASTLTLTNVQSAEQGLYSVLVSNALGSVTSHVASLTVVDLPIIVTQPTNQTVLAGQPVIIAVGAVGSAPLSYQWMANCSRPISGATSPTFRIKSASPADSGSYCVTVSNPFGTNSSQSAVLRVLAEPKLTGLVVQGQSGVTLSFSTVANLLYSVYSSDTVPTTNWAALPNALQLPGTGNSITVQDPSSAGRQRFYKIVVQ